MQISTTLKREIQNHLSQIQAEIDRLEAEKQAILRVFDPRKTSTVPTKAKAAPEKVGQRRRTPTGQSRSLVLDIVGRSVKWCKPLEVIREIQGVDPGFTSNAIYQAIAALKKEGLIEFDDSRNLTTAN